MVKLNMMKEKFTWFEIFYYIIATYCLWSSQDLFLATVKLQGTSEATAFDINLIFLGAIAPLTTITSSLPIGGNIVGIFILLSPLLGTVLCYDFRRVRFGCACFILTMATTSQVVTGTYFNLMAGLGGLIALFVVGMMFLVAVMVTVRDEIKKQLKL